MTKEWREPSKGTAIVGGSERVGDRAVRLGMLTPDQVEALVEEQQRRQSAGQTHLRLGFMMTASGLLTKAQLVSLLEHDLAGFRLGGDAIRIASNLVSRSTEDRTFLCVGMEPDGTAAAVASQIALAIALMKGQPVLLVDADPSAPSVAEMFRVRPSPGFSEVVAGDVDIDDAIVPSGLVGLDVMPAGAASADIAVRLLESPGREVLAHAASLYKYVVMIGPAAARAPEVSLLAQRTDASIIVAVAGKSARKRISELQSLLEQAGPGSVGIVLTREDRSGPHGRRTLVGQEPIRVVMLLHTIAYGGVETILINWARHLPKANILPTIVCFESGDDSEKPFADAARAAGIDVRTIPWGRRKPLLKATRALIKIIREVDAHVVHTHNVYADIVGLLAARRTGITSVCSLYVWGDFGWKRNVLQKIDEHVVKRFDLVTAQCAKTQRDTVERGIDAAKTRVLKAGFDFSAYTPIGDAARRAGRIERGIAPNEIVLVNVARFYPEKAQSHLLKAFAKIRAAHPETRLWMLGTGPLEDDLRAEARALGIEDGVTFVGFIDELSETLQLADIQVHPAFTEGVPLAVCSGMASRLPVVASAVGGIPEVIVHGETGMLVPSPVDPDFEARFVACVLALIEDADARKRLGESARRFIEADYSLDAAIRDIQAAYRAVLA